MALCMKKSARRGKYQWLGRFFFQVFKTNKINFRVLEILYITCYVVYIQFKCTFIDRYGRFLCLHEFASFNRLHQYSFLLEHMCDYHIFPSIHQMIICYQILLLDLFLLGDDFLCFTDAHLQDNNVGNKNAYVLLSFW